MSDEQDKAAPAVASSFLFCPCECGASPSPTAEAELNCWWCGRELIKSPVTCPPPSAAEEAGAYLVAQQAESASARGHTHRLHKAFAGLMALSASLWRWMCRQPHRSQQQCEQSASSRLSQIEPAEIELRHPQDTSSQSGSSSKLHFLERLYAAVQDDEIQRSLRAIPVECNAQGFVSLPCEVLGVRQNDLALAQRGLGRSVDEAKEGSSHG